MRQNSLRQEDSLQQAAGSSIRPEDASVMDPGEKRFIKRWHENLESESQIRLVLTEDRRRKDFAAYAERFSALAPKIHIRREESDAIKMPAIVVGANIYFHLLPSRKELGPFLDAITQTAPSSPPALMNIKQIEQVTFPARIDLYIALTCGFCPNAVSSLVSLAANCSPMRLSIIDAGLFHEQSQANGIRSVPTTLFDDTFRWTGGFDLQELVDRMVDRDPAGLPAASMEGMIREGGAAQVAEMMLVHGSIFPAFIDLLVHEKWPVRLGAMVAMETVAEKDSGIAAQAIGPLIQAIETAKEPVRGDIYYLLGEIGDESLIPTLDRASAREPAEEVKEVLAEAAARIRRRHKEL